MATRAETEKAEQQRTNSAKKRSLQAKAEPKATLTPAKPRTRTPKKRQNGVPSSRSSGQY